MADNKPTPTPAKVEEAPKAEAPAKKEAPAKAYYETTGEFQLYDVATNITVPHDGKAKLNSTSSFVIRNLELKKLRKVD